jgi:hypothetical protein
MIIKCIVSLTAIVLACHSPAEVVRSMLGARGAIMANPKMEFGGLTFTALSANSKVSMLSAGSAPIVSLETSSDGINWSPFVVGATTNVLANVGDKVYFRAGSSGNTGIASSTGYNKFEMSGTIAASGNVMSLLSSDFDDATTITSNYCFYYLFRYCTSLASAPALPATVLALGCYFSMFRGCTSLVSAPELPATVLASYCYYEMFQGCRSLASAPQLPATVLAGGCYRDMFSGCTSLASVHCSFTTWGTQTTDWMKGVGSTGTRTFTKPAALPTEYGTSKIPVGWTVVDL